MHPRREITSAANVDPLRTQFGATTYQPYYCCLIFCILSSFNRVRKVRLVFQEKLVDQDPMEILVRQVPKERQDLVERMASPALVDPLAQLAPQDLR